MTSRRSRHRVNPAVARRSVQRDGRWSTAPAILTPEHVQAEDTRSLAASAPTRGIPLGEGHFGRVYRVETDRGPVVVKLPVAFDAQYQRLRTREEMREYLLHEAGVANELAARGHAVVPETVFVDLADGTPALVREYGEPVTHLTVADLSDLERALAAVLADGWRPADDLQLYRRADGSIYVGDVGVWGAPVVVEEVSREAARAAERDAARDARETATMIFQRAARDLTGPAYERVRPVWDLEAGVEMLRGRTLMEFLRPRKYAALVDALGLRDALGLPVTDRLRAKVAKFGPVYGQEKSGRAR